LYINKNNMSYNENSNVSVNGPSCSYNTLNNYNGYSKRGINHPQVAPTTTSGIYIVPDYASIGYNALTHGGQGPSCAGYFTIDGAYGKNANNCSTKYMTRVCKQ
jgi:hypothetical protein